jgi:dTDP-glucose 4,6-dehydratase
VTHILVTGAAGFIGSNFVDLILAERADVTAVTGVDKLGYAGDQRNLESACRDPRFRFVVGDICDTALAAKLCQDADEVAHFAAESMVDRSVLHPRQFLESNVLGTGAMLQGARDHNVRRFLHISTPEVYGQRVGSAALENDAFAPRNVYAASKAAAEMVVSAYLHSFRVPVVVTRGSTAIGPRQHPEKVTPRLVISALRGEPLPVYGDGGARRDFIHVADLNRANETVLRKGQPGQAYNVTTGEEMTIRDLAYSIVDLLGRSRDLVSFTADRVAHDMHYRMDSTRLRALGWSQRLPLRAAVADTVDWYRDNRDWWAPKIDSADFQQYLERSAHSRREFARDRG